LSQQIGASTLWPFIVNPPREFSHSTFNEHVGEESMFVHEGQVEADIMNQRIILERGDALHLYAKKPNRIGSREETQAELMVV
ncbi:cupin domain-containing protein, partial [Pseudomonas aeruginosa]